MASLSLGTSSWHFPAWRGAFYPEGVTSRRFLEYYSRRFNSVEVNTSFYALPDPATLINWVDTVPAGFTFALKFPRAISHEKRLTGCERDTLAFLDILRALGSAAAPGFLQLPPALTRKTDGRVLANYLEWLANRRGHLRLAVEVRAQDLMTESFVRFLAERGLGFVLVERVETRDLYAQWRELAGTVGYAFIRWIGDDRNGPKGDRELSAPRDTLLERWSQRMADLLADGVDVYGYAHNPFEGHSPGTVDRLWAIMGQHGISPGWPPKGELAPAEQLTLL